MSLLTFSLIPASSAFELNLPLEDQIEMYNQVELTSMDEAALMNTKNSIESTSYSPDFNNDHTLYAGTTNGTYINASTEPNFYQDSGMPVNLKSGPFTIEFGANYDSEGIAVAYNNESIYMVYSKGTSWSAVDVQVDEQILQAWPGPGFASTQYVYFTTPSGLYRQSIQTNFIELLVENDADGEVVDFTYAPSTTVDSIFYVAKGSTVMKTENFGSTWFEHDIGAEIKELVGIDDEVDNHGELAVIYGAKGLSRATNAFDFYSLNLPSGVDELYSVKQVQNGKEQDMIINTNQGIYTTYDDGSSWANITYDEIDDYSKVTDVFGALEAAKVTIFLVRDGILYRDLQSLGNLEPFMNGISSEDSYAPEGSIESYNILDIHEMSFDPNYTVDQAILLLMRTPAEHDQLLYDGQMVKKNWEEVTPNEAHIFENQGTDLRWRIEMSTDDSSKSPIIYAVAMDFGFDEGQMPPEDGLCEGFTDVEAQDPLCPALSYVKEQGIFEGYPDGTFKPNQAINRAETVKVIVEGFDVPQLADPATNLGFSDVILGEWYMKYLATAQAEGIIEGYPDGTFKPEQTVNYVELIKIFFETADVMLTPAPAGSQWYQKYLDYAEDNDYLVYQILDSGMKRGDVATLFYEHSMK
ncbi:MAG: S-layer homology domain-containing protein [Candidatus Gracilibacteria bacterium]